jgi:hypothetical protein
MEKRGGHTGLFSWNQRIVKDNRVLADRTNNQIQAVSMLVMCIVLILLVFLCSSQTKSKAIRVLLRPGCLVGVLVGSVGVLGWQARVALSGALGARAKAA